MKRVLIIAVAAALPWMVSGCGESTQVTVYKQGRYQGKPDTAAWDNAEFKGDKVAWENAIRKRNQGQNEYSRGTPTPN
jgi:hypothetical protein